MEALDATYQTKLDAIADAIQKSENLEKYLDEEEDEYYTALREEFEPQIYALHNEIAADNPLQLFAFEEACLVDKLEGMFLPRILGFSVLRGEINEHHRYTLPQSHFKKILMTIVNSSNFDIIKQRTGQTVQVGFAMSSDIWITNLLNEISNKKIKYFLQSQKNMAFQDPRQRALAYSKYKNQFRNENYFSAIIPQNKSEMQILFPDLKLFLMDRIRSGHNNTSLNSHLEGLINNPEYKGMQEHLELMALYFQFFDVADKSKLTNTFTACRKEIPEFSDKWFTYLLTLNEQKLYIKDNADANVLGYIDQSHDDQIGSFYKLMEVVNTKGYVHQDAIEAVRVFYNNYEGVSIINKCVRESIFNNFNRQFKNLEVEAYADMFEASKHFAPYMEIFGNQQFNQDIKDMCMVYIRKLLKKYIDKRGRDYQDIKKFVVATFTELNFMTPKQLVELFKTRRKKKPANT